MEEPILIGAVLYDPKVSVIWDIIREFFDDNSCPCDVVYFTNYKLQVTSLLKRQIDIAWNSPLAWLDAQRRTEHSDQKRTPETRGHLHVSLLRQLAPFAGKAELAVQLAYRSTNGQLTDWDVGEATPTVLAMGSLTHPRLSRNPRSKRWFATARALLFAVAATVSSRKSGFTAGSIGSSTPVKLGSLPLPAAL